METPHYAVIASLFLATVWISALFLGLLWQLLWSWIDDGEHPIERNPAIHGLMKIIGREELDGLTVGIWLLVALILWPLTPVFLFALVTAFRARDSRRRHKLSVAADGPLALVPEGGSLVLADDRRGTVLQACN